MPPAVLDVTGGRLIAGAPSALSPGGAPGPGVFKVDWALDRPIPWRDPLSPRSATVHLGGSAADIVDGRGCGHARRPSPTGLLSSLSQPSVFDPVREHLSGMHTALGILPRAQWIRCRHDGGDRGPGRAVRSRIPRHGHRLVRRFPRASIRRTTPTTSVGDIGGGRFGLRKVLQLGDTRPFSLGGDIYLGSSAAPPGGGVHGMCGYLAAGAALGS